MRFARNLLIASSLAFAPLAAASCQQIPPPKVEWVDASVAVPFTLYRGNRIVAPGTVNGHKVEFLLDSGASVTVLDKAFARSIGIPVGQSIEATGSGGKQAAEIISGVTFTIGGLTLSNATVAVIDFSDLSAELGRPMDVVLGRELFDNAALDIDWQAGTLNVHSPDRLKPAAAAREVKLGRRGPFNSIDIAIDGEKPVTALFDLGNGGALSLPERYWSKVPSLAKLNYAESKSGGVGGLHASRAVTVGSVTYGGQRFRAVPATLSGELKNGAEDSPNAGIGFLKQFKVTLDLGHDRMFLEPLANPPGFTRDRTGARTRLTSAGMDVTFVSPNSPAAQAGLKSGDRISAINGVSVTPAFFTGAMSDWASRAPGQSAVLTLADGREIRFKLADYY